MYVLFFALLTIAADSRVAFVQASEAPRAVVDNALHDFGAAEQGARLVHRFTIRNAGTAPLTIAGLKFSAPGMTGRMKPTIAPGSEEALTVEWNTAAATGTVEGKILLAVNDPATPQLSFAVTASIKPGIEFLPYQAVYTSVYQGEPNSRRVRVVNHRDQPVAFTRVEQQGDHFRASIAPVEAGRVYELQVTVPDTVPPGRYTEAVFVYADDPKTPRYMVPVNIIVKPDVSANPDAVDFGRVSLKELAKNPSALDLLKQTVIVRKRAGTLSITGVTSDVPGIVVRRSTDGPSSADAFRVDIAVAPDSLRPGPFTGRVTIRTDDAKYPEIVVVIRGVVE